MRISFFNLLFKAIVLLILQSKQATRYISHFLWYIFSIYCVLLEALLRRTSTRAFQGHFYFSTNCKKNNLTPTPTQNCLNDADACAAPTSYPIRVPHVDSTGWNWWRAPNHEREIDLKSPVFFSFWKFSSSTPCSAFFWRFQLHFFSLPVSSIR